MIISFNGDFGSGKSTIAKRMATALNFEHYYMGQILRDLAAKRGMTLVELLQSGETDPSVDQDIDKIVKELGKTKDNFLIESRTAWYFIPQSLKIYLKVDEREGAKRIFKELKQENQRNEDSGLTTIEAVLESNRRRRATDRKRYQEYYGIDPLVMDNYDFVLDTTNLSIEEVFSRTMDFVLSKMK